MFTKFWDHLNIHKNNVTNDIITLKKFCRACTNVSYFFLSRLASDIRIKKIFLLFKMLEADQKIPKSIEIRKVHFVKE